MNLFKFLKSVSGKIQLTMVNTSAMALVVGGLAAGTIYNAAGNQTKQEMAVRSLSSLSRDSSYEGLQRRNGLLTSINVKDGLNQVATAEERAAMEAGGSSTNFGLDNVERVQNVSFGSAAQTSETDGLGMGGNKAVFSGPIGSGAAGGSAPGVHPGAVAGAVGGASSGAAGGERPTLGTASMARASGNAFNAAAGSVGGGSAASGARGASSRASGGSSGSGDGYQLSGAMPSGTNAISSLGLSRGGAADGSTFMAGGRYSTTGRGARSFREKNDLKDISKRSADAAGNRNRAANEGSRAFLASTRNSGGMTVEGGVEVGETGSADFKAPEASRLKAVGDWSDDTDKEAERRDKARKTLTWLLIGTVVATALAIPFGYQLISKGKNGQPFGWGLVIAGCAIIAAALATAIAMVVKAGQYAAEFSGGFLSTFAAVIGGVAIACLGLTVAAAFTNKGSPLNKFFEKIMPKMKKLVISQGKNLAVGTATNVAVSKIQEGINKS